MGLDASISKTPKIEQKEVQYWRKNWVMNNWMDAENCVDKEIHVELMESLIEFIDDKDDRYEYPGSEGWKDDDWCEFKADIENIITDMKENSTYKYTYNAWW